MYKLTLAKPRFKFSASHFTIFSDEKAEALHGHNYRVNVRMSFKKVAEDTGLTVDFQLLKKVIGEICERLDEKILLPIESPYLEVGESDTQVEVKFADRCYAFPKADCCLLGVRNICSEELARWFHQTLSLLIKDELGPLLNERGFTQMTVAISETQGQTVTYSP